MGAYFRYTSKTSIGVGIIAFIVNIFMFFIVFRILVYVINALNLSSSWNLAPLILSFISLIIFSVIFSQHIFHPLSAYLYAKTELGVDGLTWNEIKYITFLFVPNTSGKWYPMTHIKELPKSLRKRALLESAKKIVRERRHS